MNSIQYFRIKNNYKKNKTNITKEWKELSKKNQIIKYKKYNYYLWTIYWEYKFNLIELIYGIKIPSIIRDQYNCRQEKLTIQDIGNIISLSDFQYIQFNQYNFNINIYHKKKN